MIQFALHTVNYLKLPTVCHTYCCPRSRFFCRHRDYTIFAPKKSIIRIKLSEYNHLTKRDQNRERKGEGGRWVDGGRREPHTANAPVFEQQALSTPTTALFLKAYSMRDSFMVATTLAVVATMNVMRYRPSAGIAHKRPVMHNHSIAASSAHAASRSEQARVMPKRTPSTRRLRDL